MAVATACSTLADSVAAFSSAYASVVARLGGEDPDLLLFYYTNAHDGAALISAASALPARVRAQGASTSLGVVTEDGVFQGEAVLGMLGLRHEGVVAGVALRPKGADPRAAAAEATRAALDAAGRPGEMPDLVLLAATAGDEEAVLDGIASVVGSRVPVFGATASGPELGVDSWGSLNRSLGRVAVRAEESGDAVAVTMLFAPVSLSRAFHGGCVPTRYAGVIAGMNAPRVVRSIDGAPASEVYASWVEAVTGAPPVAAEADLLPLGREVGRIGDYPLYALSFVAASRSDGGLTVMSDIAEGDEVRLMTGSADSVVGRPARAMEAAINLQCTDVCSVAGGLVIVCAGLLPRVERELEEMRGMLRQAVLGRPFLVAFAYGEQGTLGETPVHANLMTAALVFGN